MWGIPEDMVWNALFLAPTLQAIAMITR